ncbi:MAG TPA: hypothetical protein VFW90_01995 [Candidatus Saccharimonadales bacterium]|nr:hypothetical protein [Candidatus Saccharimonadales bacterium]
MEVNKQVPAYLRLVRAIFSDLVVKRYKHLDFWILSAFIPTFIAARLVVHIFPGMFFQIGGHHVHHFAYGFILLAVSGYVGLSQRGQSPPWVAALFGVGLALALDEAGMWLNLTDRYYNEVSEDIIIVTMAVLINLVYFKDFWITLIRSTLRFIGLLK